MLNRAITSEKYSAFNVVMLIFWIKVGVASAA